MTDITLEDIKAAADKKYASLKIGLGEHTIELRNALRLSEDERDRVSELQDELSGEDDEGNKIEGRSQTPVLEDMLRTLCATEGQGNKLVDALGGDLTLLAETFESYKEKTQLGEASPSQD